MILNKNPLHIGYVLKRYPRFSETFIVNEILAHEQAGAKIDIFALGPVDETHFQDSISRVRAPVTRYKNKQHNTESLWHLLSLAYDKLPYFSDYIQQVKHLNIHQIAQAILLSLDVQERKIQHLHAHFATQATTVTRLTALFTGVSYSFTAHAKDIYYQYEDDIELELKLRDCAKTITVSDYNLDFLQKKYSNYADKVHRLYNGINLDKFPYSYSPSKKLSILTVGRLVKKKGFPVLIDAINRLRRKYPNLHCNIIGDGPLKEALKQQIQALGIEECVTLTGPLPQPDIINAMKQASIFVAPCIVSDDGDRDGLPTVLLEAMALGTPVISTHVAGIPELVQHQNTGMCIKPNDSQDLADSIELLLNDPHLCNQLSISARQLIEKEYDIIKNAHVQRQIFQECISQKQSSSQEKGYKP